MHRQVGGKGKEKTVEQAKLTHEYYECFLFFVFAGGERSFCFFFYEIQVKGKWTFLPGFLVYSTFFLNRSYILLHQTHMLYNMLKLSLIIVIIIIVFLNVFGK